MTTPAHTSIDRTVSDITPNQRETIEDFIGNDLAPESERASARHCIHELLNHARDKVQKSGIRQVSSFVPGFGLMDLQPIPQMRLLILLA